jgi:hypothetical protein
MNLQEASERLKAIMPEGYYGSADDHYFFSNVDHPESVLKYHHYLVVIQRDSERGVKSLFHKESEDLAALMAQAEAAVQEAALCN